MNEDNKSGGSEKVDEYDSQHGKYKSNVSREENSQEAQLGTVAMPKAADPSPFKMGGMGNGK